MVHAHALPKEQNQVRTWVSFSPAVTLGPVMQEDFKLIIISTKHFTTKSLLSALSCGVKKVGLLG